MAEELTKEEKLEKRRAIMAANRAKGKEKEKREMEQKKLLEINEEKAKPLSSGKETVTVPLEQFTQLVEKVNELSNKKDSDILNGLINKLKPTINDGYRVNDGYADSYDPDDRLDKPVTYIAYSNGFSVFDKKASNGVDNIPFPSPEGRAKFEKYAHTITKTTDGDVYTGYCVFKTHSKKQVEWLEDNPRSFNIDYFRNSKVAVSMRNEEIRITTNISDKVNKMSTTNILGEAEKYGLIGGTPEAMRGGIKAILIKEALGKLYENQRLNNEIKDKSNLFDTK